MTDSVTGTIAEVAIVGAGAAGLAAAIFAARQAPGMTILALDGARKIGAKILISGGGRCNVTNVRETSSDFWGGSPNAVKNVLAAFPPQRTVEFFRELGVSMHEEENGKLFPDTHDAHTVLDALLREAGRLGVQVRPGHRVTDVEKTADGFVVTACPASSPGTQSAPLCMRARKVVLATGGMSLPKTGSDGFGYQLAQRLGHALVPPTPGLAPLVLDGSFHKPLSGISQDVEVTVKAADARPVRLHGAMLWTHFGASGPVMLDASRHWHRARLEGREVEVRLNLLPDRDFAAAEKVFTALAAAQPRIALSTALATLIPARVAEAILAELAIAGQTTLANLSRDVRRRLAAALVDWPLPVLDSRGYTHAEVTAGGVPLSQIDPATMASRRCPGLFLVGELLDVDGRIGGFNFQWAWSSGYVAGGALAKAFAAQRQVSGA